MRYIAKFNIPNSQPKEIYIDEKNIKAFLQSVNKKQIIEIDDEIINTAYFISAEKDKAYLQLSPEQKEALKELRAKHKTDQRQIETVNEEGLARLKEAKSKLINKK